MPPIRAVWGPGLAAWPCSTHLNNGGWGQALTHHPHLHCVVPGGGLSPDATRWIAGSQTFFLPVKPLAKLFRRLFLEQLQASFEAGELTFFNDLATLADPAAFKDQIADILE